MQITIISGGQTGVDRAALDVARLLNIPHQGWCPKGRLAEDGVIPASFNLKETASDQYDERTDLNVRDSDGTVIFSLGKTLKGGSLWTQRCAIQRNKPYIHITLPRSPGQEQVCMKRLREFIESYQLININFAGPRASQEAGVYTIVYNMLSRFFADLA
jgi:hypothetical protein